MQRERLYLTKAAVDAIVGVVKNERKVKANKPLQYDLAIAFDRDVRTVQKWAETQYQLLTSDTAVSIIEKHTGLQRESILTNKAPKGAAALLIK